VRERERTKNKIKVEEVKNEKVFAIITLMYILIAEIS